MEIVKKIWRAGKDILFPIFCVECGAEGEWWCEKCRPKNPPTPFSEKFSEAVSSLDGITVFFSYEEDGSVGKLIKYFKYNYARDAVKIFEKLLGESGASLPVIADRSEGWAVIPVPLHPRRERERGFNQARILAEIFFPATVIATNLVRSRYTTQQAKLTKEERQSNLLGAFSWAGGTTPEKVLLIDDVYTTGATMQECARVLKNVGVKIVWGLALARG